MTKDPLVSVIVPSYCHAPFILDSLQSIYNQSYPEIELIVIDDRSTDDTMNIVSSVLKTGFAKRFRNVVLEQNRKNMGAHASINHGISRSSGDYVAVINSDDLYVPTRIERLMSAMHEAGSEIAFSLVDVFSSGDENAGGPAQYPHNFLLFPLRQRMEIARDPTVSFSLLRSNVATSTGNLIFSRALYDKVGPFLPLKYCHDWDFVLQASFYTEPTAVLESLYHYRLHGGNSFASLAHVAGVESEVVFRRFMRRGLRGESINPLFPSAKNWPGFFELFLQQIDKTRFFEREAGVGERAWRIYDKARPSQFA
jgi:glycosyltransferase involved in cell wall biosynthesis